MRTIKLFNGKRATTRVAPTCSAGLLLSLALFFCAGLHAQVTIGSANNPARGAILDLNSAAKGGLLLSNVNITSLDSIPAGNGYFPGIADPDSMDTNRGLRGALVYNTNPTTGAGIYVWTGKYWMPAMETETEQILFTIDTNDGVYYIPTTGRVGNVYHTYDWDISVDGGAEVHYSSTSNNLNGILLNDLPDGKYQIKISPHNKPDPGWGNAFGYYTYSSDACNAVANKQKIISVDAPLTTLAFAPKTTEDPTNASFMFAYLFSFCTNLTTPIVIKNNYKLPETITSLSFFLFQTHFNNPNLTNPIDLSSLSGWFNSNTSITDMIGFLADTHSGNTNLESPIDLSPLSGWFSADHSISSLMGFLNSTHYNNRNFILDGQAIFPNWIKTLKLDDGTPIRNVDNAFYQTFSVNPEKAGDTDEPTFEDGTPLSSMGNPSTKKGTYSGRTGITNDQEIDGNWK
jgi:hypothetical protein